MESADPGKIVVASIILRGVYWPTRSMAYSARPMAIQEEWWVILRCFLVFGLRSTRNALHREPDTA